jgi:hypothetical protein
VGRGEQAVAPEPRGAMEEDGADAMPLAEPPAPGLAADDVERLRAALDELLECERLLGTLRAAPADLAAEG